MRFERRENVIVDARTDEERTRHVPQEGADPVKVVDPKDQPIVCASINAAKKKSIELQKTHGRGCLRAAKPEDRRVRQSQHQNLPRIKIKPKTKTPVKSTWKTRTDPQPD